jgi:general secretion pathway protein D
MSASRRLAAAIAIVIAGALAACVKEPPPPAAEPVAEAAPAEPAPDAVAVAPLTPPPAGATPIAASGADPRITRGSGSFVRRPRPEAQRVNVTSQGGYTLNFVDADVREVVRSVLGDILKLNYTIDPTVQATVTVQTNAPLDRAEILPALEAVLRLYGLAITETNGVYFVVSAQNAPRQARASRPIALGGAAAPAGFTNQIVPLRFVGADEMQRILEPLVPQGSVVRVDNARNLLIVAGTSQDLATIAETVQMFDVDWLSGMSFGLFPLKYATAKALAGELEQAFGGGKTPLANVVRFLPLERLNAILVLSPQPMYVDQLRAWIDRLDRPAETADQRIYVYFVQNGRAANLAAVLTKLLTGDTRSSSSGAAAAAAGGDAVAAVPPDQVYVQPTMPGIPPPPPAFAPGGRGAGVLGAAPLGSPFGGPPMPPGAPDQGIQATGIHPSRIMADEENNALLIIATPREYAVIETALQKLDIAPLQVLIEASIVEVTLTNDLRYGVQWFLRQGNNQFILSQSSNAIPTPQLPGFSYLYSLPNVQVVINALEAVTKVKVISAPQIVVLNNQAASLQVGDQVPIATQSAVAIQNPGAPIVNSIQLRDTGVILKVTPRVNESGLVLMDIAQEVSAVVPTTTSSLNSPTIQQRKVTSSVAVRSGESLALGGLIKDSLNQSDNGIPIVKDIPLVGNLFGQTTDTVTRTELLVLITPRVIRNDAEVRQVTNEIRRRLQTVNPVLQRIQ